MEIIAKESKLHGLQSSLEEPWAWLADGRMLHAVRLEHVSHRNFAMRSTEPYMVYGSHENRSCGTG